MIVSIQHATPSVLRLVKSESHFTTSKIKVLEIESVGMAETDSDQSRSGVQQRDSRYDANIYNIDIGAEIVDYDSVACTPGEHEGRPAIVIAMGPNDEDVRKVKMCTECQQVEEEVAYDDVQGITLEAVGTVRDRVKNYPGKTEIDKIPIEDVLEMAGKDPDDVDITHTGYTEDELLIQTTEADSDE